MPDSVKNEVHKLSDKYKLGLKLDVVGIPMAEEWGTLDTLRHIQAAYHNTSDILTLNLKVRLKTNRNQSSCQVAAIFGNFYEQYFL